MVRRRSPRAAAKRTSCSAGRARGPAARDLSQRAGTAIANNMYGRFTIVIEHTVGRVAADSGGGISGGAGGDTRGRPAIAHCAHSRGVLPTDDSVFVGLQLPPQHALGHLAATGGARWLESRTSSHHWLCSACSRSAGCGAGGSGGDGTHALAARVGQSGEALEPASRSTPAGSITRRSSRRTRTFGGSSARRARAGRSPSAGRRFGA